MEGLSSPFKRNSSYPNCLKSVFVYVYLCTTRLKVSHHRHGSRFSLARKREKPFLMASFCKDVYISRYVLIGLALDFDKSQFKRRAAKRTWRLLLDGNFQQRSPSPLEDDSYVFRQRKFNTNASCHQMMIEPPLLLLLPPLLLLLLPLLPMMMMNQNHRSGPTSEQLLF